VATALKEGIVTFNLRRLVLAGALILPLLASASAISEPQLIDFSRFEAVGRIESIDTAGQLQIHGQAYRLAPQVAIHGNVGTSRLLVGQEVGYRVDPRSGGTTPLITDIWVLDE
jgi:hypothetical protein